MRLPRFIRNRKKISTGIAQVDAEFIGIEKSYEIRKFECTSCLLYTSRIGEILDPTHWKYSGLEQGFYRIDNVQMDRGSSGPRFIEITFILPINE